MNFEKLEELINKSLVDSKKITSGFKLVDQNFKKNIKYNDSQYLPFFYYLGKELKCKNFFELGVNLAIFSGCFFRSCKTVEYYLGFQQKKDDFFNTNIPRSNISLSYRKQCDFYIGDFFDKELQDKMTKFDLVFINEEYSFDKYFGICESIYLNNLNKDGIMIFSNLNKKNSFDIYENISKGYRLKNKNFFNKIGVLIK